MAQRWTFQFVLRQLRFPAQQRLLSSACSGPLAEYTKLIESHKISRDERQLGVVKRLQMLHDEVQTYERNERESSFLSKVECVLPDQSLVQLFHRSRDSRRVPRGVYLHGSVGSGKTYLMDLFYTCCLSTKKRRVHFNQFMLDVHTRIHELKKTSGDRRVDPLLSVSREVASNVLVLCLDEFQVTDVADAMILRHFFSYLLDVGVVVVATSNRAPKELYLNGLQRSQFLPFIDLLVNRCDIVELTSEDDYRRSKGRAPSSTFVKSNQRGALEAFFVWFCQQQPSAKRGMRTVPVFGREIKVAQCCGHVALFTFDELCLEAMGAADYLALAKTFNVILLEGVPYLRDRAAARRFITLIDILYDQHVGLVMSAEVHAKELFEVRQSDHELDTHRALQDDLQLRDSISLFSGEEELFALERTVSRLEEMHTAAYWSASRGSSFPVGGQQ